MRPGSVLVVDDQADIVELVIDVLRDEGYSVSGVTDGTTALSAIEEQRPVLLLLDMFMPHMNGVELWDYIQRQDLADIAVVLMTASPTMAEGLATPGTGRLSGQAVRPRSAAGHRGSLCASRRCIAFLFPGAATLRIRKLLRGVPL